MTEEPQGAIHPLFRLLGPVDPNSHSDIDRFIDDLIAFMEKRLSDRDGEWWTPNFLYQLGEELKGKA